MNQQETEILAQDAALLSACELGLGSLLHAFHAPLTGYLLSLNQVFLLSRSVLKTGLRTAPLTLSGVAAFFKSLSPAGKKLTPMLAISAQGLLYTAGTFVCGANLVGAVVGGVLSSLWGFLQPLLIYYFLFGHTLVRVAEFFYGKLEKSLGWEISPAHLFQLALALVALKALLAAALVFCARFLPESWYQQWQKRLVLSAGASGKKPLASLAESSRSPGENARQALQELFNPLFLLSLAATAVFFLYAETPWSQVIWYSLRPLGIGFLLFFAVKYLPLGYLKEKAPVFASALEKVRGMFR
jgi:hypothetical protein